MAVPYGTRFPIEFDELFPQGAYIVGEVIPLREYQWPEDKARNQPVRPWVDEATGMPLFKVTVTDQSAEKDRDKSVTVEIAAKVQPVPPEAVGNLPFRPVVLEGLTVQPRAETSGQTKWHTWIVRASGLRAVETGAAKSAAPATGSGSSSAPATRNAA
ncbi:MAG: hypothetical protein M3Q39_07110 [Actinomycetota bacterium]|nr:hypothetical protein [Actinomycetota bacterium]